MPTSVLAAYWIRATTDLSYHRALIRVLPSGYLAQKWGNDLCFVEEGTLYT
jgi:hypothetical protein